MNVRYFPLRHLFFIRLMDVRKRGELTFNPCRSSDALSQWSHDDSKLPRLIRKKAEVGCEAVGTIQSSALSARINDTLSQGLGYIDCQD